MNPRYRIHLHKNGRELVITRVPTNPRQPLPLFDIEDFTWPDFSSYRRRPYDHERDS